MGNDETKNLIAKYKELEFEKAVLEQTLKFQQAEHIQFRLNIIIAQIEILDKCLCVLNADEAFIIRHRFILPKKWDTVINLYEETFGYQNGKAERTLKKIQSNALAKIQLLISNTNTGSYLKSLFVNGTVSVGS